MRNVFRLRYLLRCLHRSRHVLVTSFCVILVFYVILFYDVTLNAKSRSWTLNDGLTIQRNSSDQQIQVGTGHNLISRLVNTSFLQLHPVLWNNSNGTGITASGTWTVPVYSKENIKNSSNNNNNGNNNNDNDLNHKDDEEEVSKRGNSVMVGTEHSGSSGVLNGGNAEKLQANDGDSVRKMNVKGDNSFVGETGSAINTGSSNYNMLLAGVPKARRVYICVGMVTVAREKGDYFFDTLASLMQKSSTEEKMELTIVVMLADRDQSRNAVVLRKLQENYPSELKEGLLLVVRGAQTDFLFQKPTNVKRTYNDSLMRVQWRSKQNLDYAALMEFSATLSTYYLHLEDDVIAADKYLVHIRDFIRENANTLWAMLEVCPHGFIGKLFRSSDLAKLVMVLRTFYLEQPCDFLMTYFFRMMTQAKPIVRKQALFFHQGKFSSLANVTRKVDKIPDSASKAVAKTAQKHVNPPATVSSNLTIYDGFGVVNAYDLQTTKFLWAKDVKKGQRLTVRFHFTVRLSKLVIETGFSQQNQKDILHNGIVELGNVSPDDTQQLHCPNAQSAGAFKNGRFGANMTSARDVRCLSIVITEDHKEWLIIREIAVFTN